MRFALCAYLAWAFVGTAFSWDNPLASISRDVPAVVPAAECPADGVKAVWVEGEPCGGKPTKFFAYYGVPEGADATHPAPGMVLIHGGVGTAYASWVRTWVKRGYAAIAADNCGAIPKKVEGSKWDWTASGVGGPRGWGRTDLADRPPQEQWPYHAVATAIRSHSFLRSLPEVDAERTGITGISWGGFLTMLTAGTDGRFKFAAPVYGCAYFGEFDANAGRSGKVWERWLELWDPSHYLSSIDVPLLWTAGATEGFFSFKQYQKTLAQFPDSYCALRAPMIHVDGAFEDGRPVEIYELADHLFKGEADLPKVAMPYMGKNGKAVVEYDTAGRTVGKIELIYSTEAEGTVLWKDRNWQKAEIPQPKKGSTVSFKLPEGTTMFFVNLITEGGVIGTSRCLFL